MADALGRPFTGGMRAGSKTAMGRTSRARDFGDQLKNARTRPTTNFRGRTGLLNVVAGYRLQGLMRDPNGTLNSLTTDFADINRRLAIELAEVTAEQMRESLVRPRVSSGRLYEALMDRRNRYSDAFGFGVGNPRWLDRSEARYWRQIDQGFRGHVGRILTGVWGESLTGGYRSAASGPYPEAGPEFTGFRGRGNPSGERNQDRLLPMGRKYAYRVLRKRYGRGTASERGTGLFGTQGIIKRPITAHRYFDAGWEAFNAPVRVRAVAADVLRRNFGGTTDKPIPTRAMVRYMTDKGPRPPAGKQYTS